MSENKKSIFLSHASRDDAFVKSLRQALEFSGYTVWADSRELLAGDVLQESIGQAISESAYFFLIFSGHTLQFKRVKKELDQAKLLGKRIVTLLLDEQTVGALAWLFDDEPLAMQVSTAPPGGYKRRCRRSWRQWGMVFPTMWSRVINRRRRR